MSNHPDSLSLPSYSSFSDSIAILSLPMPASTLHGQLCAFLCTGAIKKGEAYLQALMGHSKSEANRAAALALFQVFSVSQQQMLEGDYSFKLLLPEDHIELFERAQAFSEWCEGFIQGLTMIGISHFDYDEEAEEALGHIREFAELDCYSLEVEEEDEKALMEINEFTRIAVLKLHADFIAGQKSEAAH